MRQSFFEGDSRGPRTSTFTLSQVKLNAVLKNTYLWMMVGLSFTAVVSYFIMNAVITASSFARLLFNPVVFLVLIVVEFILVFVIQGSVNKMNPAVATVSFVIYSILNGVTLTPLVYSYTSSSVALVFLITAGTFGSVSVFALITKKDLSGLGTFLFMGLMGLIIATVVNIFLHSGMLQMLISYAGVLIFTGLTAYDTQNIKNMAIEYEGAPEKLVQAISIQGALKLYLDFINMFIYLLKIFGKRD